MEPVPHTRPRALIRVGPPHAAVATFPRLPCAWQERVWGTQWTSPLHAPTQKPLGGSCGSESPGKAGNPAHTSDHSGQACRAGRLPCPE